MNVCIAAGGTGGHLYPGIALAQEMVRQEKESDIQFVGTRRGLESRILPATGFDLCCIAVRGVMGKSPIGALRALAQLPLGIAQCIGLLRRRRSELVIGIGGYTSPPLLVAAFLLGIPRVIVEPNVVPGLANRVLSRIANLVLLGFEETRECFRGVQTRVVGMPLRHEFRGCAEREGVRGRESARRTLLVFGGSQGSRAINREVIRTLSQLHSTSLQLRVVHQTGEEDCMAVREQYADMGIDATVVVTLNDMPQAYADADLVICRAGAGTISELTACGRPAILIPFPAAAQNHQLRNAQVIENQGAAVVIEESQFGGEVLADMIQSLMTDFDRLEGMAERSRWLGHPRATEESVNCCRELLAS